VAVLKARGIDAVATRGGSGQFDVLRNGELVFSKAEAHRFPGEAEILAAVGAG
jgi:Rdx family